MSRLIACSRVSRIASVFLVFCSAANAGSGYKLVTAPNDPPGGEPQQGRSVVVFPSFRPQVINIQTGRGRELDLSQQFASFHISDPDIIEAAPLTNHSIILQGRKEGTADIIFVDEAGKVFQDLEVSVDNFVESRQQSTPDKDVYKYGSIEIHNKAQLDSQTNYRCGPDGCHYTGETTVEEPAPLPVGHSEQKGSYNYSGPALNAPPAPPAH